MVGRLCSGRMAEEEGGGRPPRHGPLPWRDCPVRPAVGERKKRWSAEWGRREGSLRTRAGESRRPCGLSAVLQAGLPSVLSLVFPATPATARDQAAFSGRSPSHQPDCPHLPPPPGDRGPQREATRPGGGLSRGEGGIAQAKGSDGGRQGHLSVLRPFLRQAQLAGRGPVSPG